MSRFIRDIVSLAFQKAEVLIDGHHRKITTVPRELPEDGEDEVRQNITRLEEAHEDLLPLYQQVLKGYSDWGDLRLKMKVNERIADDEIIERFLKDHPSRGLPDVSMAPKRKQLFKQEYEKIRGIKKSKKGEDYAHCTICDSHISLGSIGKSAIDLHQKVQKHIDAARAAEISQSLSAFLPSQSAPTAIDDKTAAAEGAWAFHVARHHHSFRSTDCVSSDGLFRSMFSDSDVAKEILVRSDKDCENSNRCSGSILRRAIAEESRFFTAHHGVEVRLLDMDSLPEEDSEKVANFITSILDKHGLECKRLTSFCADNAPVNFGGSTHRGKNNVFSRLQARTKHLVPIGCPAHILHNSAQKAAERLPVDIEAIVYKIASYFKGSTLRHEKLKEFCDFVEVNYATLPTHTATRWTTLGNVLNRMLQLWDAFHEIFSSLDKPPKMLEDFFSSSEAKIIVQFLQSVLQVFEKPILLLQRTKALLPELVDIMHSFRGQVISRQQASFYGAATSISLGRLFDKNRVNYLKSCFEEFYETALEYINKWFHLAHLPYNMSWVMLGLPEVGYGEVRSLASQLYPDLADEDSLFDEVSTLNTLLQQVPPESLNALGAEEKWMKIFEGNGSLPIVYQLVSAILSIPVSNAFVEGIFSLCSAQWTDERNLLQVGTVKSLVQTKVNFDMNCTEMHGFLLKNSLLLNRIRGWEKYF